MMIARKLCVLLGSLLLPLCATPGRAYAAPLDTIEFNRDIRPILSDMCWHCHGPGTHKAGVRLDRADLAQLKGESGAAPIVPGKSAASEMIRRILSNDPAERMPPEEANKTLSNEQKDLLRRWVDQGAKYEKHWAFITPAKPTVPTVVDKSVTSHHPIDALIAARLSQAGLKMSGEADRPTLIRRAALAITGLPPTLAEIDQYLNDKSPQAYEQMVDRYLNSPRYGEEMARHWLDVARYADTHGLHLDNERQMWPYRDWVVQAFNANMPFDQFTIEQLAGDLLPDAKREQLVATGFNRCGVTTSEGGSITEEWYFRNAVERTSTMAETWLGLTAGCAVCHDHKFDPLTQRDFYSMYAFFYSAAGSPLDGNRLLHEPVVKLSTPEQDKQLAEMAARIATLGKSIEKLNKELAYNDPAASVADDDGNDSPVEEAIKKRAVDPAYSFQAWLLSVGDKEINQAPKDLQGLLRPFKGSKAKRVESSKLDKRLLEYYVQHICAETSDDFAPLIKERDKLTKDRETLDNAIPSSYIFRDEPKPRDTFVMLRGQYDRKGDKVEPNTPAELPPLTATPLERRATRLDLARWLVSSEQPLTARVTVNRFWQQLFGTGLVKTSYDFGSQGEVPSHPQLLDWLAVTFREQGWNVKQLVRLMVTSATFRQSSRIDPVVIKLDGENRLYARGPRFRLDAEPLRDSALFIGGLLELNQGGKAVKPYQPPNIWEPVGFAGSNTRFYKPDSGAALYRRSLYTFLKRTAPAPFMANFDAPNREQFCTRRERSNTPLQALQLMNDVQYFEAARGLAQRMLRDGGTTVDERITHAYRLVLARRPEPDELAIVRRELSAHLERFRADAAAADKVIHVGDLKSPSDLPPADLAAYTLLANMLLNLDEAITRN